MKIESVMYTLIILLSLMLSNYSLASSDAGIAIGSDEFSVELYYGTELEYKSNVDFLVKNPAIDLYNLLAFVSANYGGLRENAVQVRVDIMPQESIDLHDYLLVQYKDKHNADDVTVEKIVIDESSSRSLIKYICGIGSLHCSNKEIDAIPIYKCGNKNCGGWVHYGNNVWMDEPRFSLKPIIASAKKYVVTRENAKMYFKKLN